MTTYRKFDWNRARSDYSTLFTDFHEYAAGDWVITTIEAGAGSATEAISDAVGGKLLITNDAANNDRDCFQWAGGKGAVAETFKFTTGKKLQFVTKLATDDASLAGVIAGLHITDTDPLGGVSDGIYFRSALDSADLYLVVEKNSTESTLLVGALEDAVETELEFYYDGASSRIEAYKDGVRVGSLPLTNAPDDEELALSFAIQNGSAVARTLTVDYIGASVQR
jgi:hypothetical protein